MQLFFNEGVKMEDAEKFQAETTKAITALHETFAQSMSRQLALGAVLRALVAQLPLAALARVQDEFEAEVDHQAALLHPKHQRPEFWREWSALIESRRKELVQLQRSQGGAS